VDRRVPALGEVRVSEYQYLAAGDLRLLYLAWLLSIQWLDEDLIAVAAGASPPAEEPSDDGLAEWIASLPTAEKDSLLTMAANGDGALVQALLLLLDLRSSTAPGPACKAASTQRASLRGFTSSRYPLRASG
jgi:hypothetical protein